MKMRKSAGSDRVAMQNALKTLAANVRFSSVDVPIHTLAVVSSVPDEGKTTVAVGLARAFADGGASVLLVECDMRRRSLATALGVHGEHGMYSVLSGHHTLNESIVNAGTPNLYFLDAEPGIPNPADILQSHRFRDFVESAAQSFDYVLFDTPPVLTFVDSSIIASIADATLLVVRQDFAKREDVKASYAQLNKAGANVIGTVLNYTDAEVSSKYYDYYHEKKSSTYDAVRVTDGSSESAASLDAAGHSPVRTVASATVSNARSASRGRVSESPAPVDAAGRVRTAPMSASRMSTPAAGRAVFSPAKRRGASASPDETSQFLANAGYVPRYSSDDASGANEGE